MMSIIEIVIFIISFALVTNGSPRLINKECVPPLADRCVEIRKCPFFADLLEKTAVPRPRHVIRMMRDNHCGFEGNNPKVCCLFSHNTTVKTELRNITNHPNLKMLPLDICGLMMVEFRIVSGFKTIPLEFPWMALIAYNTDEGIEFRCGGTIINKRYIVTAAHCVKDASLAGVRLGEHDLATVKDCNKIKGTCAPPVQDVQVEKVIIHPNFLANTYKNDIALIRLAKSADFSRSNIKPICLPTGDNRDLNLDRKFLIVSGWGVTEDGFKSSELLKVSVPVVPNEICNRMYRKHSPIAPTQVCAGGYKGRDSCGGDSGGPLKYTGKINNTIRYIQYGIVSYGPRYCGSDGQPAVYTRVTQYIEWILNNLKSD